VTGKRYLKISIQWGLALCLVFLLFYLGGVSELTHLPEIHWGYVFLLFVCTAAFTLAHNFRWKEIVESLSEKKGKDFFTLYQYLVDSYVVGKFIPMDVSLLGLRSYLLTRYQDLSISLAAFSVLLDRFLDLVLFLFMALPSFLLITGATSRGQTLLVLLLLLIVQGWIIHWKKGDTFHFLLVIYRAFLARWLSKVPLLKDRLKGRMEGPEEAYPFSQTFVIHVTGWNYIKYIFLSLRFYFTGMALGIPLPWVESFFFLPFVQLSGLVNVTPAGLGVVEMTTYGALYLMGISKPQILLFVVGQRILLFATFLGLFAMSHLFSLIRRRVTSEQV